ncbi:heme anaerobic degradation radical SAM methyltransferase ChuW/HutW [Spongorhabdus nitratireducens]
MTISLAPELTGRHSPDPLRFAFEAKKNAHAGGSSKPLAQEEIATLWQQTMYSTAVPGSRAAYFHIPFCRTHCSYCPFFQNTAKQDAINQYVSALLKEIEQASHSEWIQSQPVQAVYFGGGTPTELAPEHIVQLGDAIRRHLPLANDVEMTFESRFTGLDNDKVSACIEAGFNRFSLGVQTFQSDIRRKMSRIDTRETMLERLDYLVATDQAAVVVDLIYGLPYQTEALWQEDLEILSQTRIHGVDLYQLIVMGSTRMAQTIAKGRMPAAGDTAMKAGLFQQGKEFMDQHHFNRLSVSHWARDPRERNVYNHLTKAGHDVIPFGCGAGGTVNGHGVMLHRSLEPYLKMVANDTKPLMFMSHPSPLKPLLNIFGAGFDLGWLDLNAISLVGEQLGYSNIIDHCKPLFAAWEQNGLVERCGRYLNLTLAGQFWNVTLSQALQDYLKQYPLHQQAA